MKNKEILLQLLSKIEDDLAKLADGNEIFRVAYIKLHKVGFNKIVSYQFLKDALINCYKYLIDQENKDKLTLNERVLLNNIDQLDDLIIEGKI